MVCRTRLTQFQSSPLLTPVQAVGTTSALAAFPGNFTNADGTTTIDTFGYLGSQKTYNLVDAFGNRIVAGEGALSGSPTVGTFNLPSPTVPTGAGPDAAWIIKG